MCKKKVIDIKYSKTAKYKRKAFYTSNTYSSKIILIDNEPWKWDQFLFLPISPTDEVKIRRNLFHGQVPPIPFDIPTRVELLSHDKWLLLFD